MAKYIQGKDGKLAGSIGDGKSKTPASAPAAPVPHPYAKPEQPSGKAFAAALSERRLEEIAEKVGEDMNLTAWQVRYALSQWRTREDYEDVLVPDEMFRYDLDPLVPTDDATARALRKLGYEHYLAQPHPVFVYGTLRTGQGNHRLMDGAVDSLTAGVAHGVGIYGAHRGFPYATEHDDPQARTQGEVIWLTQDRDGEQARQSLDHLEGFDSDSPSRSHYERVLRPITVPNSDKNAAPRTVMAWMYMARGWSKAQLVESDRIPDGDWVEAKNAYRQPRPRYDW